MFSRRFGLLALVACLLATSVWCQNTSSLRGTVTDPSAALIPGATVTATGPGNKVKVGTTNQQGGYVINGLAPGTYAVRVMAKGFAVFESTVEIGTATAKTLDAALAVSLDKQEVTVTEQARVDVDPSNNASALVLKGADLDMLSDDPDDLASDLQALAGPGAGPNGGQIYIDGFTGGRLPPKESIREVRINQNPFSSEYDKLGYGRIEIFTKPGTDKYRGNAFFEYGNDAFNSRNPFAPTKAPYDQKQFGGNISGPISKKSSFFIDLERRQIDDDAIVNAFILDPSLNPTPFSGFVFTPSRRTTISPRMDYQLSPNNTLVGRYTYTQSNALNSGVGQFSLASRGVNTDITQHTVQLTETAVLNARAINETRVQYIRNRTNSAGTDTDPSIILPDAFTGGGAPLQFNYTNEDRYEVGNTTSLTMGANSFKFGARIRGVYQADRSTSNFNGTYTFANLARYQQTLQLEKQGVPASQLQALGAGPNQFTLTAGTPISDISQYDLSFFAQDDWRLKPNFTLSLGLRYETQDNISDHKDFAPRVGFAWGVGGGKAKQPKTVIRGGFGIFYDRFTEDMTLQAIRLNGITQQQFVVPFPTFFPDFPSVASLDANKVPQAVRRIDSDLHAPYMMQTAIGVDRQLPKNISISVNYTNTRGLHVLRSRDINAPLPGTYTGVAGSGVRPYGNVGDIYLYESSGIFNQRQVITNVNARISRKFSLFGYFTVGSAKSNTDNAGSFPANQYNLINEYSRAGFDSRFHTFMGGSITAPWGLRLSPYISQTSSRPFNITVGRDLNGDSIFNDRPSFATDLTRSGVVQTPFGNFDTNPTAAQTIIPRNYGVGPSQFSVNLRMSRTFGFGNKAEAATSTDPSASSTFGGRGPGGSSRSSGGSSRGSGGSRGSRGSGGGSSIFGETATNKRYNVTLSVSAHNLLNHENLGMPVGTLLSPLFGQSNSLGSYYGPSSMAGNRRVDIMLRFSF